MHEEHTSQIPHEQLVAALRSYLQVQTCCPDFALSICMILAASFCLDSSSDAEGAAKIMDERAARTAKAIRKGGISMGRAQLQ